MIARVCNHHTAVGMSHQNDVTVRAVDGGFRERDVFGQGLGWVLHDYDVVASLLENVVNTGPSRTVHETTVDKDNGFALLRI